jgi:hypothetical protein
MTVEDTIKGIFANHESHRVSLTGLANDMATQLKALEADKRGKGALGPRDVAILSRLVRDIGYAAEGKDALAALDGARQAELLQRDAYTTQAGLAMADDKGVPVSDYSTVAGLIEAQRERFNRQFDYRTQEGR